jgi:endonuclease/exonuclease/phosphatase family metal-dependent hydrolase
MATLEQASLNLNDSARVGIEHGSFAPSARTVAQHTKLVIATYNIRYAVGSFLITGSIFRRLGLRMPRRRPKLVARHIRSAARALTDGARLPPVDILALQEADKQTLRAGGVHVTRELAREMRMHYTHAPFNLPRGEEPKSKQWYLDFEEHMLADEAGDTGIALLSRWPLQRAARVELPFTECAWRPRLALEAVVRVREKNIHLYNAHIDPHATVDERLKQHQTILDVAEKAGGTTILFGDFNTLTAESRVRMRELLEAHGYATPFPNGTATWRAGLIRLHTDWIFVRGARVTRWGVAKRLGISDHWPVWAE